MRVGIPDLHPHRWRHSYAWWLYFEKHVPLVTVQRLLGHVKLTTTQEYLGVSDDQLFDVVGLFTD